MTKKKPAHEVRLGRIRATIWLNDKPDGASRYDTVISRLYKTEEDKWDDSKYFWRDDLLLLAKVADLAHSWICQKSAEAGDASVPFAVQGEE